MENNFRNFKYIDIPSGENICYRDFGVENGENILLFIHGNHSSQLFWDTLLLQFMENLQKNTRMITLDMKSFGRSSYNNPIESMKDFSDDLYSFMHAMNITYMKNITVIGYSLGGGVAMQFVSDHSQFAKRLILLSSVSANGYVFYTKKDGKIVKRDTDELKNRLQKSLGPIWEKKAGLGFLGQKIVENVIQANYSNDVLLTQVEEQWKHKSFVEANLILHNFELTKFPSKIKCPVLIIHGDKDSIVDIKAAHENKKFVGNENCQLVIKNNQGHFLQFEKNNSLYQDIHRFVFQSPFL